MTTFKRHAFQNEWFQGLTEKLHWNDRVKQKPRKSDIMSQSLPNIKNLHNFIPKKHSIMTVNKASASMINQYQTMTQKKKINDISDNINSNKILKQNQNQNDIETEINISPKETTQQKELQTQNNNYRTTKKWD